MRDWCTGIGITTASIRNWDAIAVVLGSLPKRFRCFFKQPCHVPHMNGPFVHPGGLVHKVGMERRCCRTDEAARHQALDNAIGRLDGVLNVFGGSLQIFRRIAQLC
jgi:hypothetical protein